VNTIFVGGLAGVGDMKTRLVSVGRDALRGMSHSQELFTRDPDA
jgi:hypothetical protein